MPEIILNWAGVYSSTLGGVIITKSMANNKPERKVDVINVPGRNGDILYMQDAWNNVEEKYEIVAGADAVGGSAAAFKGVAEWLYGPVGYQLLQDTTDPGYFRRAYFKGPMNVADLLWKYGRATISFICRPERFKISGEEQLCYASSAYFTALNGAGTYTKEADHYPSDGSGSCAVVSGDLQVTLNNPTPFASRPYFYLYGVAYPTMLNMAGRIAVTSYTPERQPTQDDNFFPYLDRPSVYVGMWGQGSNPDFKIDSSLFTSWSIGNSTGYDNARITASKGTGSGQIGMNVSVNPNTRYAIKYTPSGSTTPVVGVSMYTARGKYVKTVWGDNTTHLVDFTTTGSTYYVVVIFQFAANSSGAYVEEVQMQEIEKDADPTTPSGTAQAMSYVPPVSESDATQLIIENQSTGVVTTMTFDTIDDFLRVDCDTMNVYRNNNQNKNNIVFIDTLEFPVLTPGVNKITLVGSIQAIGIKPRWWTL